MTTANKITMARMAMVPFFVAAALIDFAGHDYVALAIFIVASATDWVDAAWWATRMGARSVQVRTSDPEVADALTEAGFQRLD